MADQYPDNKYEGLFLGEPRQDKDIDVNAIPPNGTRPATPYTTSWVFPEKPGID